MRVKLNHMFTEASGKLCKKESTFVAYNAKTGKMYTGEYHDREDKLSEKEQQARTKFNSRQTFASNWWNTNKEQNTENYQTIMQMYDDQRKYGNPYSYFLSLIQKDMSIKLKNKTVTGAGTTPTPAEGDEESSF